MSGTIKIYVDDEDWIFEEKISVRLIKCGRERCLSGKTEESGRRQYYSLHYVLQGETQLLIKDIDRWVFCIDGLQRSYRSKG